MENIAPDFRAPAEAAHLPWYDSAWLRRYHEAKAILRSVRPDMHEEFVRSIAVFHTPPDFQVRPIHKPFDESTLAEIRGVIASLRPSELELHETRSFGRFIVHDHPALTALHRMTVELVSEVVGEPVEPSYNFLSLYTSKGKCSVHLDAPSAKWTLDLCIDQNAPWPIYFSQVRPWTELEKLEGWKVEADWQQAIKSKPELQFTPHLLRPGQAVVFSGSSQWHYRDPASQTSDFFCHLLFLHFIPRGTRELVKPGNWARLFDVPELLQVADRTGVTAAPRR